MAGELAALYDGLASRRRPAARPGDPLADRPWILADLHLHTSWSHDCQIPVAELLDHAEETGLGAIAVTDHNVFGGALEAVEQARGRELIVIPGEEVKTDSQGEVIGLFLDGGDPAWAVVRRHDRRDPRAGGIVYLPHPFDRIHTVPDPTTIQRHLAQIDVLEVYNARLLFETYNEEALRFARKYGLQMGAGRTPTCSRESAPACCGCGRSRGPRSSCSASKARRSSAARARSSTSSRSSGRRRPRKESADPEALGPAVVAVPSDEISEKYLQKAISETNELGEEIARSAPEGAFPVIGSGHPLADLFMVKYGPQPAEAQEGVAYFGRAGQAILKSLKRLRIDPLAVYGTNCIKFAGQDEEEARRS